jgi:hypothetical protein
MNDYQNQPENRSVLNRIWNPTKQDEVLVRIVFWVSIIACLLLPRMLEPLGHSKVWNAISAAWLVLAIYLRFKIYLKR